MSEQSFDAMKAVQWEITKGHLRACVAIQGSMPSSSDNTERWQTIDQTVEAFIKSVEDYGLHE